MNELLEKLGERKAELEEVYARLRIKKEYFEIRLSEIEEEMKKTQLSITNVEQDMGFLRKVFKDG